MATTRTTTRKTPAKAAAKPRAPAKLRAPRKPAARAKTLDTSAALSIGAAVLTVGAAIAGYLARRQIAAWVPTALTPGSAEHDAPDLALDKPRSDADDRAPVDFRPNMDAPISAAEREALRPATGPAPSLVSDAGTMNSQTGASN